MMNIEGYAIRRKLQGIAPQQIVANRWAILLTTPTAIFAMLSTSGVTHAQSL
jgi:hypothetical protein